MRMGNMGDSVKSEWREEPTGVRRCEDSKVSGQLYPKWAAGGEGEGSIAVRGL